MVNKVIRAIYILAAITYLVLSVVGRTYYEYVEVTGLDRAQKKYIGHLIAATLVAAAVFYWVFAKLWPVSFRKLNTAWRTRIVIPLLLIAVSFYWNEGVFRLINVSTSEPVIIDGVIKEKYYTGNYKKRRRYFLEIREMATDYVYVLRLRRRTYESIPDSAVFFKKEFKIGSLGIMYRKDR